jgi:hypothetical protein
LNRLQIGARGRRRIRDHDHLKKEKNVK